MKWKLSMLICFWAAVLWLSSYFSIVSAQVLIDGHWYPINPNVTVPSGDLDVPKNNPSQSVSTSQTVPATAITIYITSTPPPAFVPASDSVQVNPTPNTTTVNTTQSKSPTTPGVTQRPGYVVPTSVLNQMSAYSNDESPDQDDSSSIGISPSAIVGSLLGAYTRSEQSVLDLITHQNTNISSGTARTLIRIVLGLVVVSIITYFVWRWIKNRE